MSSPQGTINPLFLVKTATECTAGRSHNPTHPCSCVFNKELWVPLCAGQIKTRSLPSRGCQSKLFLKIFEMNPAQFPNVLKLMRSPVPYIFRGLLAEPFIHCTNMEHLQGGLSQQPPVDAPHRTSGAFHLALINSPCSAKKKKKDCREVGRVPGKGGVTGYWKGIRDSNQGGVCSGGGGSQAEGG